VPVDPKIDHSIMAAPPGGRIRGGQKSTDITTDHFSWARAELGKFVSHDIVPGTHVHVHIHN
jgi:hypothetical protein